MFLEEQQPEVRGTLTDAENVLNDYRAARESIDLNFETESLLRRLVEIETRLNELQLLEEEIPSVGLGRRSMMLNTRRWNGSSGLTTGGCSNGLEIYRQRNMKSSIMTRLKSPPWRHDSN